MSVIRLCYLDTILLQNLFANIDDCSTDSIVALSLSYILNIKASDNPHITGAVTLELYSEYNGE